MFAELWGEKFIGSQMYPRLCQMPDKKKGGTLVLGPCIGADLVRSTLVLGAEPEGVKVSAPRNLDFPL